MCVCVCVCVCVLGSKCLSILLTRDDFESAKCCLDPWLICMIDCIHVCTFLFFEKLVLSNLHSFSIPLDNWSIYRAFWSSFYRILDSFPTDSQSIEVGFCLIASRSVEILLHALFFTYFASFFYLVIHSILVHYIHAFIWIPYVPWSSLYFSGEAF